MPPTAAKYFERWGRTSLTYRARHKVLPKLRCDLPGNTTIIDRGWFGAQLPLSIAVLSLLTFVGLVWAWAPVYGWRVLLQDVPGILVASGGACILGTLWLAVLWSRQRWVSIDAQAGLVKYGWRHFGLVRAGEARPDELRLYTSPVELRTRRVELIGFAVVVEVRDMRFAIALVETLEEIDSVIASLPAELRNRSDRTPRGRIVSVFLTTW